MNSSPILQVSPLGFPWKTQDPFLFCVYHADDYPKGNDIMGPDASLAGRNLGQDFVIKDGWRMYHGSQVPGFPAHPHRGFETVTIVKKGLVDHSDSLGAMARFGHGDVQWLTSGKGLQHAEMFPLVNKEEKNPLVLFQLWLNLPKASKFVEPHFRMLWSDMIPKVLHKDSNGRTTEIELTAGTVDGVSAPAPTPNSWAADPANEVAIFTIKMAPGAMWTLPLASAEANRSLYYYQGDQLNVAGQNIRPNHSLELRADQQTVLKNGEEEAFLLFLQGRPINEPVVQHGPFVMNSQAEIMEAMQDYQRTQFGGWPWKSSAPVHPREQGRFARHIDGKVEEKAG
ncbi:pirin family protein [Lewinella sp. LCG006]|uniref:pirin family protein n=1 Tax=Lewinella sp. LCG006 TaxID=3231911 RepID=UPI00345F3453